jgi:molybdate transport system substrate-binding protein
VRSSIALAVASGAPRPAIENESALRDAVRRARTVGYSTGPSGVHLLSLMKRWGFTGKDAPRLVQTPPGIPVGTLIARGEVDLGFQQLGELMHEPGVDVVGLLPSGAQAVTVFAAAVCTASFRAACAKQFLAFLASPQTTAVKLRLGMEAA